MAKTKEWFLQAVAAILGAVVVAMLGWEISNLNSATIGLRADLNANNEKIVSAIGDVRVQIASTNGRIDATAAKIDGTNSRLDELLAETKRRR